MNVSIVGIAGGSGAGKSSVSYELTDVFPDEYEVVNLDDFQKLRTDSSIPRHNGRINWDHPDIVDWPKLISAITTLQMGQSVTMDVWSHRSNPDFMSHGNFLPRTIYPRPVILLEGYLALHHPVVNRLYFRSYYLDADFNTRMARRGSNTVEGDQNYDLDILVPMHHQYVEPTKLLADMVVDVTSATVPEVAHLIRHDLSIALLRSATA
jgi:uridine kinase